MRSERQIWVLCLVMLVGCSSDRLQPEDSDGGLAGVDGSLPVDASSSSDASQTTDASLTPPDAGVLAPGCGQPHAAGETTVELTVNGVTRSFILLIPTSYDPNVPMPLVYGWHGSGLAGASGIRQIGVVEAARGAALFVFPNALPVSNNDQRLQWNLSPTGRDLAFFDVLHAHLLETLCVDQTRTFSFGFSLGGFMSNLVACLRSETQRAIASFHGGGPDASLTCGAPVAAFLSHRQNDEVVDISLGIGSRDHWLEANTCGNETSSVMPSPCVAYQGCAPDDPVVWCLQTSGTHVPPPSYIGTATWDFFERFIP